MQCKTSVVWHGTQRNLKIMVEFSTLYDYLIYKRHNADNDPSISGKLHTWAYASRKQINTPT